MMNKQQDLMRLDSHIFATKDVEVIEIFLELAAPLEVFLFL